MNAPLRRGACPALSDPMPTGDGLIARLNPAGGISPDVLVGLADASIAYGNGLMEITQRGNLQFRGLSIESAPLLADAVNRLGVPARTGLPIDTGPLAGLDPNEVADPRPLTEAIRTGAAGLAGRLGPKVSVIIDGGHSGMDEMQSDIRLTAAFDRQAVVVWRLAIAGDAISAKPLAGLDKSRATEAALAVLGEIAAMGITARAKDLPAAAVQRVVDKVSHPTLPPSGLPAIFPTRGEMGGGDVPPLSEASPTKPSAIGEDIGEGMISPRVGEMSGRTEGGVKERGVRRTISLKDGRLAVSIALPFGSTHAADLRKFVDAAKGLAATEIRFAPRRSLLLLCPTETSARDVRLAAEKAGLVTQSNDPRLFVSACAGSEGCASGQIPARAIAAGIASTAKGLLDGSLTVHVSGCAKGCAHPGPAALTFVGGADGARLVVNGTASGLAAKHLAANEIVAVAERLSRSIKARRHTTETAAACLARLVVQPEEVE